MCMCEPLNGSAVNHDVKKASFPEITWLRQFETRSEPLIWTKRFVYGSKLHEGVFRNRPSLPKWRKITGWRYRLCSLSWNTDEEGTSPVGQRWIILTQNILPLEHICSLCFVRLIFIIAYNSFKDKLNIKLVILLSLEINCLLLTCVNVSCWEETHFRFQCRLLFFSKYN